MLGAISRELSHNDPQSRVIKVHHTPFSTPRRTRCILSNANKRELLLRFSEHQKGVRAVLVDVASPNLVHSAGEDCTVLTYDLRKERRTVAHM